MNTTGVRTPAGIFAGVLIFAAVGSAPAQPLMPGIRQGPMNPPALSPYLNLPRSGASAGVNYYGLVRPQQEFRNAYQGLQQGLGTLATQQNADPRTGFPETGHVATFLNTGGYFLSLPTGMGAQSGRTGAPRVQNLQTQQAPVTPSARGGRGMTNLPR